MNVAEIIQRKGSEVATVKPDDAVASAVAVLAEKGFGALVVSSDGLSIDGIISERDVVRHLAHEQEGTLRIPVEDLMTRNVVTCTAADDVDAVIRTMLDGRFRHMPVVDDAEHLCGLVSLGDLALARVGPI